MKSMGDFYGLPTRSISSPHLRLEFLAQAGPRIVRLFLAGSDENQLVELPELKWETPLGNFCVHGGHRLWHAPEATPRTYVPDNEGLVVEEIEDGVRLCRPTEAATGIRKRLEIRLLADRPALTLHHELQNDGLWPVELAPWAITQLPLGGVIVLPQQVGPLDAHGLLPNRHLVLWPYTRWDDTRLQTHDDYVLVQARAQPFPFKLGYLNRHGWAGYLRRDVFFCKRFELQADQLYPDGGCNVETYCYNEFVELETLAPLRRLEPCQSVTHVETWEFYSGVDASPDLEGVRNLVGALGLDEVTPDG
jgi:hypothetical protein